MAPLGDRYRGAGLVGRGVDRAHGLPGRVDDVRGRCRRAGGGRPGRGDNRRDRQAGGAQDRRQYGS